MPEWLSWQRPLYWVFFGAGFLLTGLWETFRPRRHLRASTSRRWALHLLMATVSNTLFLLFPAGATLLAVSVQDAPWGVLNRPFLPVPLQYVLSLGVLDFMRWAQHFAYHRLSWLWRLHQVHHADPEFDLTTALRFHPLEALLTQGSYLLFVYLVAPQPLVVMAHELAILAQGFFSHANASLPPRAERILRRFFITPDLHRIHHSLDAMEQQHNFGSLFPWWDQLLRTFQAEPRYGHEAMAVGLAGCDSKTALGPVRVMAMPFHPRSTARIS